MTPLTIALPTTLTPYPGFVSINRIKPTQKTNRDRQFGTAKPADNRAFPRIEQTPNRTLTTAPLPPIRGEWVA